jgi:hypothetical protein
MNDDMMSDKELDKLLAAATSPQLSLGFNDRLLQKLDSLVTTDCNNIVPFPARPQARQSTGWPVLLPLLASMAAALVGGLYLGAATNLQSFISTSNVVASADESDLTGFEDLDTAMQDNQS